MDKDPFSLKNLPAHRAPPGLWSTIERQLDPPVRQRPPLAIAAAVLVAAVIVVLIEFTPRTGEEVTSIAGDPLLAGARQASMALESEVSGARGNVLAVGDAARLAWMEAELRLTDELLSERPSELDLWLKRTELLGEMARLYEGNDWHTQIQLASY